MADNLRKWYEVLVGLWGPVCFTKCQRVRKSGGGIDRQGLGTMHVCPDNRVQLGKSGNREFHCSRNKISQ